MHVLWCVFASAGRASSFWIFSASRSNACKAGVRGYNGGLGKGVQQRTRILKPADSTQSLSRGLAIYMRQEILSLEDLGMP